MPHVSFTIGGKEFGLTPEQVCSYIVSNKKSINFIWSFIVILLLLQEFQLPFTLLSSKIVVIEFLILSNLINFELIF